MSAFVSAVIVAAGGSVRMGIADSKQFIPLLSRPAIEYTLKAFQKCHLIKEIVIVCREQDNDRINKIIELNGFNKVSKLVKGGDSRADSVRNGIGACSENAKYYAIHDGARPFPDGEMLERTMEAADKYGACVAAVPTKDTMKVGNAEGIVERTLDRKTLWNVQTPQVFRYDLICQAHREIRKGSMEGVTDDSMIVETLGICPVKLVMGSYDNIKVTTPEDLVIAENILSRRTVGPEA